MEPMEPKPLSSSTDVLFGMVSDDTPANFYIDHDGVLTMRVICVSIVIGTTATKDAGYIER
jgi:hypothetical protein